MDEEKRFAHREELPALPEATSKPAQEASPYNSILQGKPIHALISSSITPQTAQLNAIEHLGTIDSDGVQIIIDEEALQDITAQTFKVLIILLDSLTRQLPHPQSGLTVTAEAIKRGRVVSIPLSRYMELCNIKDAKEARSQLNDAIRALYSISLEWPEASYERPEGKSRKVKVTKRHRLRITDHTITQEDGSPVRRGVATFKFSFDMAEYLSNAYIMPYHPAILQINTHYHPYSIPFGWKLCALFNMNFGKSTQGTTTVETLLRAAKGIPRYSSISSTGQIYDRIIRPFDRDLYALQEAGVISSYYYFTSSGESIDRNALGSLSYSEFSKLSIHYTLSDYPDQTPRIEAKQRLISTAISRNKRLSAKKKSAEAGDGDGEQS